MKQIRILEKFEAWYVNIWSPLLPSSLTTKNKMKEAFKAGCNVAYKQAFEDMKKEIGRLQQEIPSGGDAGLVFSNLIDFINKADK